MNSTHKENLAVAVESLLLSTDLSDLKIKSREAVLPAHRIVFKAFGNNWGVPVLDMELLDWTHLESHIVLATLTWLYTSKLPENLDENSLLSLMNAAGGFKLPDLVKLSEEKLVSLTTLGNCFAMYSVAASAKANVLLYRAAEIISQNWETFLPEHFKDLLPELVCSLFIDIHADPLHKVVSLGRLDVVESFSKRHSNLLHQWINVKNKSGELPLELACTARRWDVADILLSFNANVNGRNNKDWNYLQSAITDSDKEYALFLLDHKADIFHTTPEDEDTCLHLIAKSVSKSGNDLLNDVTKILLEKGADPNRKNADGLSSLHLALQLGCLPVVTTLLEHQSVDVSDKSSDGRSPLQFAFENHQYWRECADLLLKSHAKVDVICTKEAENLLQIVIKGGQESQALYLCEKISKDHLDHVNLNGESCLHYAAFSGMAGVVAKLIEFGANPNLVTLAPTSRPVLNNGSSSVAYMGYKQTCLHYAILHNQSSVVSVLLDKQNSVTHKLDCNLKDSIGNTPLSLALNDNCISLVPKLISAGADVNAKNSAGLTMLHKAIADGASQTAMFLISNGADINATTMDNKNPLHMAIENNLEDVIEALCKRGADLSVQNENKHCPLWSALLAEQFQIAKILVRNGADTDAWGPGPEGCYQTLLHAAIDLTMDSAATLLIESGCDINTPQRNPPEREESESSLTEWTPLHLCCIWGLEPIAQSLLEHGALVNKRDAEGKTPLHIAIENQQERLIEMLLDHPSLDIFERDNRGLSPLAVAVANKYHKAAKRILEKFPSAAEQFNKRGLNLLHLSLEANQQESVLFLLSINLDSTSRNSIIDVNSITRDAARNPPLHLAAMQGNEVIVRSLILAGAKVDAVNAFRQTALHVAASEDLPVAISALLSQGASPDLPDGDGNNALHVACKHGQLSAVKVLLTESNVDAEALNTRGQNPLHTLARYGKENASAICNFMAESMPNFPLDYPDVDGNTALLTAYMKGNGNLCRALVKAGACLGTANLEGVTIFNYQVATKQLLYNLLESLEKEPRWSEGECCLECGNKFSFAMRRHHCRHCGRLLCSKCSDQDMAIIKYKINKPVRVCEVCFAVLNGGTTTPH